MISRLQDFLRNILQYMGIMWSFEGFSTAAKIGVSLHYCRAISEATVHIRSFSHSWGLNDTQCTPASPTALLFISMRQLAEILRLALSIPVAVTMTQNVQVVSNSVALKVPLLTFPRLLSDTRRPASWYRDHPQL